MSRWETENLRAATTEYLEIEIDRLRSFCLRYQ
jgi:hypothetical protein